ncbi:MAG: ceramide glucosyltransferase [Paracoccaceae bacterium]
MTALALTIAAATLLVLHLGAIALYLLRLAGPEPQGGVIGQPFVTLLRPVCGLDPFDAETLRSSFHQDYPRYEVIFCAQTTDDPVIPLVRRLIAQHPHIPARLLVGLDRKTGNPKLNNVWKGWQHSTGDWICMTDSNLMLPRNYLANVVGSWGPSTGLVSSPPVGIMPQNMAGHLECAFLNGNQALLQHAAASAGMGFAQGKTLFFNKPLLEHAGGLHLLGQTLAEDAAATRVVREMGRKVSLIPLPAGQPIGKRSVRQVWDRQLRWSRIRRDAFPLLFMFEIFNGALLPATFAFAASLALGVNPLWGLAYAAIWYLAELGLNGRAGWPTGWHLLPLFILRDMMMPAIWLATYLRRGFEWRGTPLDPAAGNPALPAA